MIFEIVDEKSPLTKIGDTPLHNAVESGNLEICKFIIENKSNPNLRSHDRDTPLHLAAAFGNLAIFKFLFHVVKDKSPQTESKDTPLHYAAELSHLEVCKFILENMEDSTRGNTLNRRNKSGETPLDLAIQKGDEKVCNLLKFYENLHMHPTKRQRFFNM